MRQKVKLQLFSKSPIEIVYGLTEQQLLEIRENSDSIDGYEWIACLDDMSAQREEFLSGIDISDATLLVTSPDTAPLEVSFLNEDDFSELEGRSDDRRAHCVYSSRNQVLAGEKLDPDEIDHVVVVGLELKHREWEANLLISSPFDPKRLKITGKYRDADTEPASTIYYLLPRNEEDSLVSLAYNRRPIDFEVNYTSYAPEFFCLTKKDGDWVRDRELEAFFNG